jgi:hypothetical protein
MGQTLADIDKKIYRRYLDEGLTHEEIIKRIPRKFRKSFLDNIEKSPIHAHYGIPEKYFFPVLIGSIAFITGIIIIFAV